MRSGADVDETSSGNRRESDCSVRHANSSLDQPKSERCARLGQPSVQLSHPLAHSLEVVRDCREILEPEDE